MKNENRKNKSRLELEYKLGLKVRPDDVEDDFIYPFSHKE